MRISAERLAAEAEATGFRSDVLEKVAHLIGLLNALRGHPFLKGKLVLKGGTALNLFVLDVPRLSVDIDLNYVGAADRDEMLVERPGVEQAVAAVCSREGFAVRRRPGEHAGGTWSLRFDDGQGRRGNLEVDLNYMFRVPLWPTITMDSHPVGTWRATEIPVLERHELAAGKLAALLARRQARDLFDAHRIFGWEGLDLQRLRVGFVVYGAMNRRDWRTVAAEDVAFEARELADQLAPTLRVKGAQPHSDVAAFGARLVSECRIGLSMVLPFTGPEREFLDLLLDRGVVDASLLTADPDLQQRIQRQPLLEWKALNVRRHKGLR